MRYMEGKEGQLEVYPGCNVCPMHNKASLMYQMINLAAEYDTRCLIHSKTGSVRQVTVEGTVKVCYFAKERLYRVYNHTTRCPNASAGSVGVVILDFGH